MAYADITVEPLALSTTSMPLKSAFVIDEEPTKPHAAPVPHLNSEHVTVGVLINVIGNVHVHDPR